MRRAPQFLGLGLVLLMTCQAAITTVSRYEKRILADFSLGDVPKYPSGYIDISEVDTALKKHFLAGTKRDVIAHNLKERKWPADVLLSEERREVRVYYYEIENHERPRVARYMIRFQFTKSGTLDRVDLHHEHFVGGVPKEMPKVLLKRPN